MDLDDIRALTDKLAVDIMALVDAYEYATKCHVESVERFANETEMVAARRGPYTEGDHIRMSRYRGMWLYPLIRLR